MYYVSIPRDLLASLRISADMFLLTFTHSEVFMLYNCMILEQLHLKTKVFKLRVASTNVLSINLT